MLHMNSKLLTETKKQRQETQIQKQTIAEQAKKAHFYQKLIKKLQEKLKEKEEHMEVQAKMLAREDIVIAEVHGENEKMIHVLQEKVDQLEINLEHVCEELEGARNQLADREDDEWRRSRLRDEAVNYLLQCVDDIRTSEEPPAERFMLTESPALDANNRNTLGGEPDSMQSMRLDRLTAFQREHILETLLSKLHRFGAVEDSGSTKLGPGKQVRGTGVIAHTRAEEKLPPIGVGHDSGLTTKSLTALGLSDTSTFRSRMDKVYDDPWGFNVPPLPPNRLKSTGSQTDSGSLVSMACTTLFLLYS